MLNKNVCPNCGQLFDTDLDKCPLCGTAPQVVDAADPVQRKRITEAERKQRRADRKEAEQEARRRRKDEQLMLDADEERQIEEEEARRKEEKRRRKEEKKAARRAARAEAEEEEEEEEELVSPPPAFTAAPATDRRGPMPEEPVLRDRRRVPRVFLALSTVVLIAALLVGGSYLLWKLDVVKIPYYEELAAKRDAQSLPTEPAVPDGSNAAETPVQTAPKPDRGEGSIPCSSVTLSQDSLLFEAAGDQLQLEAVTAPSDTTDELSFTISDTAVAKVSPVGIVTAVGPGTAVITVRCGDAAAECSVVCDFKDDAATAAPLDVTELVLVKDDMTFFAAGENYVLSVTNVPVGTLVQWRSLDESIATVDAGGHVVAVGPGTTRVFASVGDLEAYCWVRCKFE